MTDTKHSLAPWEQDKEQPYLIVKKTVNNDIKKGLIGIAYVYQTDVGKETALANAKVIAAAPEMYDALTALCKKADTTGNLDSHWDEILSNAKAVLAKAKGETT